MPFLFTKLAKISSFGRVYFVLFLVAFFGVKAQDCVDLDGFAAGGNGQINWSATPEFSLPFPVIYGVPLRQGNPQLPLTHGFSSITDNAFLNTVQPGQRTQIYYGNAFANASQPWELHRSPWGNDMDLYSEKWLNDHKNLSAEGGNPQLIDSELFSFDIERVWRFDFEILQQKTNAAIPESYRSLSDAQFLTSYKRDMRDLYARSVKDFLAFGKAPGTLITSYSDSPIVNTFQNIQGRTWQQWKTDKSVLNFICTDDNGNLGGPFYDQMDVITPSAYYYFDYPHPFAGEYLSYLLFQIEANKAWTSKPVIPFVWMRYSFNPGIVNTYIKPWMAEATAIFPFFSGADGLWLWEDPVLFRNETQFETYSWFQKGLYRLSLVKDFFEGNHELVIQTSARDYNENKKPIWRGVFKEGKLLVAAHNPFAANANEAAEVDLVYKGWSGKITLKGYETRLCIFDLTALGLAEDVPELNAFPNPVGQILKVNFWSDSSEPVTLRLLGADGKELQTTRMVPVEGMNETSLSLETVRETQIILQLLRKNGMQSKKLVKLE